MEPQIISQTPISMAGLRQEIEKIKKRDKEPSIRITKMEDYLNSFPHLSPAKEKELVERLVKLEVPRMKEEHSYKIADTLPKSVEHLKVVLQGYVLSVSNENLKKIADVVKEVAGGK